MKKKLPLFADCFLGSSKHLSIPGYKNLGITFILLAFLFDLNHPLYAQSEVWSTKTPMNVARTGAAAGVINGKLYVVGGSPTGGYATTSLEVYDPLSNLWSSLANALTSRALAAAVVVGDKLYVMGGCINSDCIPGLTGTLEVYDPATNSWTSKTGMPTPRTTVAAGAINNKIYVAGGMQQCGPCTPLSVLEIYDVATDTWTTGAPMPGVASHTSGAIVNGKFYVVGGSNGSAALNTIFEYDPSLNTWITKANMLTARYSVGVGVINNQIYAVSGSTTSAISSVLEVYNPTTNSWITKTSIPTARYASAVASIGSVLYVAGSSSTNTAISTVEAFTAASAISDIDGNTYNTVTIGTQTWMQENLKTTHYRNGDAIPNVTDNTAWAALTTDAYCNYNNDLATSSVYGKLYNFYAIADYRYLCPLGWNIPTTAQWTILTDYLGGESIAASKLKESGTTHWQSPNTGATNSTNFTALPGGSRIGDGTYASLVGFGHWWSSSESTSTTALYRAMGYDGENVRSYDNSKKLGLSIRCLKEDLTKGLVAYYPFNGNANDESGNGNNGTNSGANAYS